MKSKLIHLLRALEDKSGFKNNYEEYDPNYQVNYSIEEYLDFPNFRFIVNEFNNQYPVTNENGLVVLFSDNSIRAELKRMEIEGLVMISVQEGKKYATTASREAPDFDEAVSFTSESIILTTKGKSRLDYFIYKATEENPVSAILSTIAIIISIVAIVYEQN